MKNFQKSENSIRDSKRAGRQWLMPVIIKIGLVEWLKEKAEFKPQYHKKKKKKRHDRHFSAENEQMKWCTDRWPPWHHSPPGKRNRHKNTTHLSDKK
jgi:hypothetical protein